MTSKKVYTLVFLRTTNQILLGLKKRGFGINKWNGFGGKVEPHEGILDAAVRELKEESYMNVKKHDLKNIGHLEFTFEGELLMMEVRVFSTTVFGGSAEESEEMLPQWFDYDKIPFQDMWPDDKVWFPYLLKDKFFYGKFHYQGHDKILHYTIQQLDSMKTFYESRK